MQSKSVSETIALFGNVYRPSKCEQGNDNDIAFIQGWLFLGVNFVCIDVSLKCVKILGDEKTQEKIYHEQFVQTISSLYTQLK